MIRRISLLFLLTIFSSVMIWAQQPKWAKKAAKAVFTLKTFSKDGSMLASTNGFFISQDGMAVSNFSAFRNAVKAVVIDNDGKEWNVVSVMGANDMYDLVKFKVDVKKAQVIDVSTSPATTGEQLWLLPYAAKKTPECIVATVNKTEKAFDDYLYYTLKINGNQTLTSCPLINENGQLVAMLQQPASDNDSIEYAVSSQFAANLKLTGLSINDPILKSTKIKKDLPSDLNQAILTLYVAPSVLDSVDYETLMTDFIAKFPQAPDGYTAKAQWALRNSKVAEADDYMKKALSVSEKKDEAHFSYAKLIFQKEVYKPTVEYPSWSLDKAVEEADAAYAANPLPSYQELKAQIRYAQKRYADAFDIYSALSKTSLRSAELFFAAARCKEMLRDTTGMIAQLDSAVSTFDRPYLKAAAPYLLARAQALMSVRKYRDAVLDFNDYEKLMPTEVTDNFYYIREQCEMEGHLFQQALNDIKIAISKSPQTAIYYAEKASIEVRVGYYDDAIKSAQECIRVDEKLSDGYLFLGLAQCLKNQKVEGVKNLQKAKQLGNDQADVLIEQYGK